MTTNPVACRRLLLLPLLLLPFAVQAQPGWQSTGLSVPPAAAPAVVAAFDDLMAAAADQGYAGRTTLYGNVIDGTNPATHTVISLHHSLAEREAMAAKLMESGAWQAFMDALPDGISPVSTTRGVFAASWGTASAADVVWTHHFFAVSNATAFVSAMSDLMASDAMKKFPGHVMLHALTAGQNGASHVISVGYESEAEGEKWGQTLQGNDTWTLYLARSGAASEYLGAAVARQVKAWGDTELESFMP